MSLRSFVPAVAALGALTVAAPALATNLIVNGGFEAPPVEDGGFTNFGGGSSFTGWNVTGTNRDSAVHILSNTYSEGPLVFNAQEGFAAMDLSGQNNSGPTSGIFQTIDTVAGQSYDISFWVGNAAGGVGGNYNLPSTVELQINESALTPFTNADVTLNGVNWRLFTTQFRADNTRTTISFYNGTALGDGETGLDNISVSAAVPEPESWALMILGFGGVGGLLRARRARALGGRGIGSPSWSAL